MTKKTIKGTFSYNAYIDGEALDAIKILIFNHGTQSKKNGRTSSHQSYCSNCEKSLNYNIINQPNDRLIDGKIISGKADTEYTLKVGKIVDPLDAVLLKDANRVIRNLLIEARLSETECVVIHYTNKEDCIAKLNEAIVEVDEWYHNDKSLLVDINTYNPEPYDTDMSVRPFIVNRCTRRFIDQHINSYRQYEKILVQGLAVANYVYTKFPNIKNLVIYVSEYDIYHNIDIYNEFKQLDNIEFKYYESDNEIKELYMAENKLNFDIIISNPPYGKVGAEITDLINKARKDDSIFINLMPANDYRRHIKNLFKYVDLNSMVPIKNGFKDANVTTHIAALTKQYNNITEDEFEIKNYLDRSLDKYFFENRNRTASYSYTTNTPIQVINTIDIYKTIILGAKDVNHHHLPYTKNCVQYKWDVKESIDAKWVENNYACISSKKEKQTSLFVVYLNSYIEKKNMVKLLYSEKGFKFFAKLWKSINVDSYCMPDKYLPKVDWAHEWTVEEILADYGYTEKEIKEVMDDLVNFKDMER